jgi:CMP-N,N'-diacetyllegionaminic acid synthase
MKKIICLICARKGSKGIKNKNIINFHNKPLIEWTFDLANSIKKFDKIYISTDSKKIITIAKKNKINVPFIRPKYLAKSNSKEIDVWKHALKHLKKIDEFPDVLVVIPATSPLRKKKQIIYSISKFLKDKSDVLITVKDPENNPYFNMVKVDKRGLAKIVINKKNFYRRQDAPKVYSMSTICYVIKPNYILKAKSIFEGKVTVAKFDKKSSIDIDDNYDLNLAKILFKK